MRLDFICPGIGRCGTTTLDKILRQYPEVCLPKFKEPVFLQNFQTSSNGIQWYEKKYFAIDEQNPQKKELVYGEINPSFGCISVKRLRDAFGEDMKIILLLRNPIKRLWSHFNFCINEGRPIMLDRQKDEQYMGYNTRSKMFDAFLEDNFSLEDEKQYLYTGTFNYMISAQRYEFFCKSYLKFFKKQNIKIILFEDFTKNPEVICQDICKFIGVPFHSGIDYRTHQNRGNYRPKDEECRKKIGLLNKAMDENLRNHLDEKESLKMQQFYGKEKQKYMDYNSSFQKEHASKQAEELLCNFFQSDKRFVEEFLGRDLSEVWF